MFRFVCMASVICGFFAACGSSENSSASAGGGRSAATGGRSAAGGSLGGSLIGVPTASGGRGQGGKANASGGEATGGAFLESGAAGAAGAGGVEGPSLGGLTGFGGQSAECRKQCGTLRCSNGACFGCTVDAECPASAPHCDPTDAQCVACYDSSHCTNRAAPACSRLRTCGHCESDSDCSAFPNAPKCEWDGRCVQCSATREFVCNGTSCDPVTGTCTTTKTRSRQLCERCDADSECPLEARCIALGGDTNSAHHGHCLPRVETVRTPPGFGDYVVAWSVSGEGLDGYWTPDVGNSCEGVLDALSGRECTSDESCGCDRTADGLCANIGVGGYCRTVGGVPNRCTTMCTQSLHSVCPSTSQCTGTGYCE